MKIIKFKPSDQYRVQQFITLPFRIYKHGTLIGGYTIRLAYEHMTPAEKKEFLRVTGYKLK